LQEETVLELAPGASLIKEHRQKIDSKHITLRTWIKRLVRRAICLSKTEWMHDLVIGLFVTRYEFGRAI
jgi:insertion element IS1 protein InsB